MSTSSSDKEEYNSGFIEGFDFANIHASPLPLRSLPRTIPVLNLSRFGEGFLDGLKAANAKIVVDGADLLEEF